MISNINIQAQPRNFHIDKTNHTSSLKANFGNVLADSQVDHYISGLTRKLGVNVQVGNFENGESARNGSHMFGQNNVSIAPNILEEMSAKPKIKEQYESEIRHYLSTSSEANSFMAIRGREITSRGIIIHADGTVTSYCSSEPTPEEQSRIDKAMEQQAEEKAERREEKKLDELREEETLYSNSETNFIPLVPTNNNNVQLNNEFMNIAQLNEFHKKTRYRL